MGSLMSVEHLDGVPVENAHDFSGDRVGVGRRQEQEGQNGEGGPSVAHAR